MDTPLDQTPQPQDEPVRSARSARLRKIVSAPGAVPALLTVSALAVVLLLAAIRPGQGQGAQVGTVPRPTHSATPSSTPSVTLTPSATHTPSATPTSTETPLPPITYQVVAGDSAAAIAQRFGVSVRSIITANHLDEAGTMHPGDKLIIPHPTATGGPATPTSSDTSSSASVSATTPTAPAVGPSPTASPQPLVHELAEGETLEAIADQYGVTVDALTEANQIADPSALQAGHPLVIPGRIVTATPAPTSRWTATPTTGARYAAPRLLYPADGAPFRGDDAVIVLEWASVSLLRDDEWYELSVQNPAGIYTTVRTKATSWRVPADMRPIPDADAHTFIWSVRVVRGSQEGESSIRIGDVSQIRKFMWD